MAGAASEGAFMRFDRSRPRSYGAKLAPVQRFVAAAAVAALCLFAPAGAGADERPIRIVVLGDSLSAGYGLAAGAGVPERAGGGPKAKGGAATVGNAGVSGDT